LSVLSTTQNLEPPKSTYLRAQQLFLIVSIKAVF
jgi:hypothetical protein